MSTLETGKGNAMENVTEARNYSLSELLEALWDRGTWEIPLYLMVFLTSVVGNVGVMINLSRKRRPTSITNAFFFNLAVSDLILTIFCMPFSFIGSLPQDFIFDDWLCRVVQLVEGTSAASSVWTLVALSVERYYVICHPIRSRRWQTLSHARHIIGIIWTAGALFSMPKAIFHEIQLTPSGGRKCTANWLIEGVYSTVADIVMFVIPLTILGVTYYFISDTLNMRESRVKLARLEPGAAAIVETSLTENAEHAEEGGTAKKCETKTVRVAKGQRRKGRDTGDKYGESSTVELRQTNNDQCLFKNKRVRRTINAVVLQFLICWTPAFVLNTIARYRPHLIDSDVGQTMVSVCVLLGYASGCFNPLTYCVMKRYCGRGLANLYNWIWAE